MRRALFSFPAPNVAKRHFHAPTWAPLQGVDYSKAPRTLRAGQTPLAENFVFCKGYLRPRSGTSAYSDNLLGDAAVTGFEAFDINGNRHVIVASGSTIQTLKPQAESWSTLSYIGSDTLDSSLIEGMSGTYIYDIDLDSYIGVITNARQSPKFFQITESTTTYSDLTATFSLFSTARAVTAHNDRLVWFNVASSTSSFPTRVTWSPRGAPRDYTISNDAGFQDLADMRGVGVATVADRDRIYFFSTEEVWVGTIRNDVYAYDIRPINRKLGCPFPRTVTPTPFGIVFLGSDYEPYLLSDEQFVPLGPAAQGEPSRVQCFLRDNLTNDFAIWAFFDTNFRRWCLYFQAQDDDSTFPVRALFYSFDNGSWFPQRYAHEISFGLEARGLNEIITWDSLDVEWNAYNVAWDELTSTPQRGIFLFTSRGTAGTVTPGTPTDFGSPIQSLWRSHVITDRRNPFVADTLNELWLETAVLSASTLSVSGSQDGITFSDPMELALSASSTTQIFVPINVTGRGPSFEIRTSSGDAFGIAMMNAHLYGESPGHRGGTF